MGEIDGQNKVDEERQKLKREEDYDEVPCLPGSNLWVFFENIKYAHNVLK